MHRRWRETAPTLCREPTGGGEVPDLAARKLGPLPSVVAPPLLESRADRVPASWSMPTKVGLCECTGRAGGGEGCADLAEDPPVLPLCSAVAPLPRRKTHGSRTRCSAKWARAGGAVAVSGSSNRWVRAGRAFRFTRGVAQSIHPHNPNTTHTNPTPNESTNGGLTLVNLQDRPASLQLELCLPANQLSY